MTSIDVNRNRPLFERALKEASDSYCGQLPNRGVLVRQEALRILAQGIKLTLVAGAELPTCKELESPLFGGGRLSATHERYIKEGNNSMKRIQRMLRRTSLVKLLAKEAKILWPTAEQIVDQFVLV